MAARDQKSGGIAVGLIAAAIGVFGVVAAAQSVARERRAIRLRGKNVLLTGGSRGLGLVLARQLVRQGAHVALCARDPDELRRAEKCILEAAPEAQIATFVCDLEDTSQVRRFVHDAEAHFGPTDILIHNAGIIQVGPMETMTVLDYEEALRVHFWAAYHLVEAVRPTMQRRRNGRIALISSIGGKVSVPHLLPYSTSKFALVGYAEGLRAELLKDGVYVTAVCPGLMRTGSPRNALFKGQNTKEYSWFAVADSLPGLTISADTAAEEILNAVIHGDAEVLPSLAAKGIAAVHGLLPGLTADVLGEVNRFLPAPGGIGTDRRRGFDSETRIAPSILTALTERAADNNNER